MTTPERCIEESLIAKLRDLKYEYRPDIRDRATLEANFRAKFEALNRVTLTDGEFLRLRDWPDPDAIGNGGRSFLSVWYDQNPDDVLAFEKQMRRKTHHVIRPEHLRAGIAHGARTRDGSLLDTLREGFRYIKNESFQSTFSGLFSEVNLGADKLGRTYAERNAKLCAIVTRIADGLAEFSTDRDALGDACEYLIGQFAAGSGKKAGEFYTPQRISDILSAIVTLDSQAPPE